MDAVGSRGGKIENDARGTRGTSEKDPDERRVLAQDLAVRQHRAYRGLEEVDGDSGRPRGPRRYVADWPLNDEHDPNGVARGAQPHSFELRASASRGPPVYRRRSCVCRRHDDEADGHGHSSDVFHAIQRVLSGVFRALREDSMPSRKSDARRTAAQSSCRQPSGAWKIHLCSDEHFRSAMRLGNDNLASSPARCVTCGAPYRF